MNIISGQIRKKLDRLDDVVLSGAGWDLVKPKKRGNIIAYLGNWLKYGFFKLMDLIDTELLFDGRVVRTKTGRVRSRLERQFVAFLDRHGVRFQYEKPVVLDGITLHPDFYLPEYNVYVELWGLSGISRRYTETMERKKVLYKKHKLSLISVYQWHLRKLEAKFPVLFKKVTGKNFPVERR